MTYTSTMMISGILLLVIGIWLIRKLFWVLFIVAIGLTAMHYYGYDTLRQYFDQATEAATPLKTTT